MIIDSSLMFFSGERASASMASKAIDFGQEDPRIGLIARKFWVVVGMSPDFSATEITVTLEDSADGKSFGAIDVVKTKGGIQQIVIPMLPYHKRHVRLKVELTGTPAGTLSATLTDNFSDIDKVQLPIE